MCAVTATLEVSVEVSSVNSKMDQSAFLTYSIVSYHRFSFKTVVWILLYRQVILFIFANLSLVSGTRVPNYHAIDDPIQLLLG